MSYYTDLRFNLTVKPEKIVAFKAYLKELRQTGKLQMDYEDVFVDDDGALALSDYYRRWGDDDDVTFYELVKDDVNAGFIQGQGDAMDDAWRILFDGQGNWKRQVPVFVDEDSEWAKQDGG